MSHKPTISVHVSRSVSETDPAVYAKIAEAIADAYLQHRATGIDISAWQGSPDWQHIKADGVEFAYVKATEGLSYTSARMASQVAGARLVGIPFGLYHFGRPQEDARQQAVRLIVAHRGASPDLLPALDFETLRPNKTAKPYPPAVLVQWCETFVSTVHEALGCWPVFYVYLSLLKYLRRAIDKDSPLLQCPLWISQVGVSAPGDVSPWPRWVIWQRRWDASVDGVRGKVDEDVLGDGIDLNSLRCNPLDSAGA